MTNKELLENLETWRNQIIEACEDCQYIDLDCLVWDDKNEQAYLQFKSLLSEPTDEERKEMLQHIDFEIIMYSASKDQKTIQILQKIRSLILSPKRSDLVKLATCIMDNFPKEPSKIHSEGIIATAIRLLESKPKVTKEFVEKWAKEFISAHYESWGIGDKDSTGGRIYIEKSVVNKLEDMFQEAGVRIGE